MAAWQASVHVVLATPALPQDYRERLALVLPVAQSWSPGIEVWGMEAGDRVEVSTFESPPQEVFARFDLREWRPELYARFLAFVRGIGGQLETAEGGEDVPLTPETFAQSLRESSAARFVRDPGAYLQGLRMREEP